jgi:hypothetical protein
MITRHVPTLYLTIRLTNQGFQNNYFRLDAMNNPRKSISGDTEESLMRNVPPFDAHFGFYDWLILYHGSLPKADEMSAACNCCILVIFSAISCMW